MSSGKKKLAIFSLLLLILAVPATSYLVMRQQTIQSEAVPATTIAFDPPSTEEGPIRKSVGETFTINVVIDTGSNSVSGVELHIKYDPQKIQGLRIANATPPFLPVVLVDGTPNNNGFAFITLGSQPSSPKKGTGTLATITFKAIAQTGGVPTFIEFTSSTRVAGPGEVGNVLASKPADAVVVVSPASAAQPTPTPTGPAPSVTSGPSPTPREFPGGGPSPTPRGNVGIGRTTPTAIPTIVPTAAKGGPAVTVQPTAPGIPVTADIGPTTAIVVGGAILTTLGIIALLAL